MKNPLQARKHVRALATLAAQANNRPMKEFGDAAQRDHVEQLRASMWLSMQRAGASEVDADDAILGSIVGAGSMGKRAPADKPAGESAAPADKGTAS